MANLTASQKKNRNKFIALIIAMVLVAAACVYVIYGGLTTNCDIMANQDFADALSVAFGKAESNITAEDMAEVKYFELSYDSANKVYKLAIGYDDFLKAFNEYNEKIENLAEGEEAPEPDFADLVKIAAFEGDEKSDLSDINFFTGVETISVSSVPVTNEYISTLTNLKDGTFYGCGFTDVSAFASLDLTKIESLDFDSNSAISDWSPLDSIKDKVKISQCLPIQMEDGSVTLYPFGSMTLAQYYEEQAKAEEEAENAEGEETDETEAPEAETAE